MEIGFEDRASWYRNARHLLRLAIVAGWEYYFDRYEQLDPSNGGSDGSSNRCADAFHATRTIDDGAMASFQTWLWLRKP
jgi:hypothetical protein